MAFPTGQCTVNFAEIWLSDRPLDCNEGAKGDTLLEVDVFLDKVEMDDYEIFEEGKPYREWCIPAKALNPGVATVAPRVE